MPITTSGENEILNRELLKTVTGKAAASVLKVPATMTLHGPNNKALFPALLIFLSQTTSKNQKSR